MMMDVSRADHVNAVTCAFEKATLPLRTLTNGVPHPIIFALVVVLVILLSFIVAAGALVYVFIGLPALSLIRAVRTISAEPMEEPGDWGPRF